MTVAFWVKIPSSGLGVNHVVIKDFTYPQSSWVNYQIGFNGFGTNIFSSELAAAPGGGTNPTWANNTLVPGEWKHLIFIWDNLPGPSESVVRIYVNGARVSSSGAILSNPLPQITTTKDRTIYIGGVNDGTYGDIPLFTGTLDELIIYHRALKDSEAKALYKLSK